MTTNHCMSIKKDCIMFFKVIAIDLSACLLACYAKNNNEDHINFRMVCLHKICFFLRSFPPTTYIKLEIVVASLKKALNTFKLAVV